MAENLKATHYRNGDPILTGLNADGWANTSLGAYDVYGDDPANAEIYGNLYNWYAADDDRGICPENYHIPSDEEFKKMEIFLGMSIIESNGYEWRGVNEGGKLKSTGIFGSQNGLWLNPNEGATNESGFSGFPAGALDFHTSTANHPISHGINTYVVFWTTKNESIYYRQLNYNQQEILRRHINNDNEKKFGFSIRCLETVEGCTHPNATNYDEAANVDDGSCQYETVQIGHQVWMTENLKATHYRNGDEIVTDLIGSEWTATTEGAYAVYGDDVINLEVYGNLYNWYAVDDERGICPDGYQVPSKEDWDSLIVFLGGYSSAGDKIIDSSCGGASNQTGYSALPAGLKFSDNGSYAYLQQLGYIWSSSTYGSINALYQVLNCSNISGFNYSSEVKNYGFSVRCLSDETLNTTILVPENFVTIQEAIDFSIDGDTILVSAGTYLENINFNGKNIALIGADRETTIIDGENNYGRVVTFFSGEDSTTLISNFTIKRGKHTGGGGIYLYQSNPIIKNLIISDNTATDDGGGIHMHMSSPYLDSLIIQNNTASVYGGGIFIGTNSNPIINNCIFEANIANAGGGIFAYYSTLEINDSEIINNVASGGGLYDGGGGIYFDHSSNSILEDVIINNNSSARGGAIYCYFSSPVLKTMRIKNNTSWSGGGIYCNNSSPNLNNILIINNSASLNSGGGIYCDYNSNPSLENVSLSNNAAEISGGGVFSFESNPSLVNSILWNNLPEQIVYYSTSVTNVNYSDIQGGWEGTGNIDADPLFNGDYTLQPSSPCIDTGDPDSDGDGEDYTTDTDDRDPDDTRIDMGAYPFYHIWGCIDDEACNYDEDANTDDGSCLVFDICGNCDDDLENDDDCLTWPEAIIGNWVYKGNDIFDSDCQENLGNICLDYFDATQCDENPICIWNNDNAICELQVPYDNIDTTLYSAFISVSEDGYYDFIKTDLSLNILYTWRAEWGVNNQNQICVKDVAFEGWHASYYWEQEESLMLYTNEYGDVSIVDDISYCIMETWERVEGCTDILAINYYNLASIDDGSCEYHYTIELHEGANLVSFWALPGDNSLDSMFIDLDGIITGVIGEGTAAVPNDLLGWIGSLSEISCTSGYWVTVSEDVIWDIVATELCPCDLSYTIHEGSNLVSWSSSNSCSVGDAIPDEFEPYITGIIGEGVATIPSETFGWSGSLTSLQPTKGYWLSSSIEMYYNWDACSCSGSFSRVATYDNKINNEYFNQSTKQAFYFIESIENIEIGDWILAYNGDEVIGARAWTGTIIDVPAMGDDGSDYTDGYMKAGSVPSFKILRDGELINLEGDIPTWENNQLFMVSSLTEAVALPETFSLDRAYPNPFNPVTTLSFAIPIDSEVFLSVYNLQGREVSTLINGNMDAGYHSVVWNADSYSSGVYFVKMIAGEFVNTQKLMLVK